MATIIKTIKASNGDIVLPRTRSVAITMSDGLTTLDESVANMIIAIDESIEDPIDRVADTLQGMTSTIEELNILHGVTTSTAELNVLDGVTSSTAELNILDGVTASTAELNVLDGIPVTLTATELGYVDGVTSSIQTQLDSKVPSLPLSSYMAFVSNVSIGFNTAAFVPNSVTGLGTSYIGLGYQIALYMDSCLSDITLTPTEITQLSAKNTWYDICSDKITRDIIKRSASFVAKITVIPFADYVLNAWASTSSFISEVNALYSTSFTSVSEIKANLTVMNQLVANERFCNLIGFNAELESAFYGATGDKITLLRSSGNFTVPAGVTILNYSIVGGGTNGATGQGNILSGAISVTPGASLAYAVAANDTGAATTFNGLSTASGSKISSSNCGLLGPGIPGFSGGAVGGGAGYSGAGGGNGVGPGAGGGGGNGGGVNKGAGGVGGIGLLFLGTTGAGGAIGTAGSGLGNITLFNDSFIKIALYRTVQSNTILSQKATTLSMFGGAGAGSGAAGGTNAADGGGGGGGGGGGFGAAGGSGGDKVANGVAGGAGGAGASGAAGGISGGTSSAGLPGKGCGGVLFLMW